MKKDNFAKGVLVGIIISLMALLFLGFTTRTPGHSSLYPLYVRVVK